MSEQTNGSGAPGAGDGGAGAGGGEGGDDKSNDKPEVVPKADHERALADLHKFKSEAREAKDQINSLQSQIDELKTTKLKDSEDYKTLWEQEREAKNSLQERLDKVKNATVNDKRKIELMPALQKLGLRDDASKLIDKHDWSNIEVEVTNAGNFHVNRTDIEREVEKFKLEFPFAFGRPKAPTVNGSSGSGDPPPSNEPLTPERIIEIENECKKKGDMTAYHAAVAKFREQKQRSLAARR